MAYTDYSISQSYDPFEEERKRKEAEAANLAQMNQMPGAPTDPNNPDGSYHYGTYTLGKAGEIKPPTGLNPGWIAPTPHYQTTNPAQSQYYWGSHPYQQGPQFDPVLYNNVPAAPATPWGAQSAQTSATPEQMLAAMQGRYPLLGTTSSQVAGPVRP